MLVFKPCENFLLLPPKFFTATTTTTTTKNSKPHHHDVQLHFSPLLKAHFKSTPSSSSPLSSTAAAEEEDSSSAFLIAVDFLMNSGGLSYVKAIQVIRQVPTLLLDGGRKPRSVITYFESIGLSKTHISKAISKFPTLLVSDVEKTLKPKIQLFLDIEGFSQSDLVDLIAVQPSILRKSMKPTLDLIKTFVNTNEDLIKTIKRTNSLLSITNNRESIEPNIDVLRHHGVPDSEIVHLVLSQLRVLMSTPERFKSIVERIVILGFKPETKKFSIAVVTMCGVKKVTWDSKIDLLKGLGWSDEQILESFRRHPRFLAYSEKKMKEGIAFFKESLNWDVSFLSQHPVVINYSLKTRVIPRYAVLKCLMSEEIIEDDKIFVSMLVLNKTKFLSKYVFKYQDQLPSLYEVYKKECMLGGCEEEDNGEITNQQESQDHGDVDI